MPISRSEAKELAQKTERVRAEYYPYWRFRYAYSDDSGERRRRMPWMPYHQILAGVLQSGRRLLAFDKARQMQITWDICAFLLHNAMVRQSTEIVALSKNQRDSEYLVFRIKTLWNNQPQFLRDAWPMYPTEDELFFPRSLCRIVALPAGEEPVRGYQGNLFFLDECGHMDGFMDRFTAAIPQISRPTNPGRIIMAGTPNIHGDWWRVVKDKIDDRVRA